MVPGLYGPSIIHVRLATNTFYLLNLVGLVLYEGLGGYLFLEQGSFLLVDKVLDGTRADPEEVVDFFIFLVFEQL